MRVNSSTPLKILTLEGDTTSIGISKFLSLKLLLSPQEICVSFHPMGKNPTLRNIELLLSH